MSFFKLEPYKKLVAMSKEKVDEALAPIRAKQVQSTANLKRLELESKMITLNGEIQELCTKKTVDWDVVVEKVQEIKLLQLDYDTFDEILDQLFPEEKKGKKE